MADTPEFPPDLLRLQIEWQEASERLAAIPLKPWTDGAGVEHRTDTGWTPQYDQAEAELRARLLEVSEQLHAHPYWATVPGKVVDERGRLKQAAREARGVTADA